MNLNQNLANKNKAVKKKKKKTWPKILSVHELKEKLKLLASF